MTPLHWKCFNELLAYNVPPPNYERGGEGEKKIKSDSNARAQIPCAPVADREDAAMDMGVQRKNNTKKLKTVFNHQ